MLFKQCHFLASSSSNFCLKNRRHSGHETRGLVTGSQILKYHLFTKIAYCKANSAGIIFWFSDIAKHVKSTIFFLNDSNQPVDQPLKIIKIIFEINIVVIVNTKPTFIEKFTLVMNKMFTFGQFS